MQNLVSMCMSYRRLSTSHSVEDEGNQCKHHAGGVVELSFCGKPQRNVHRGKCLGKFYAYCHFTTCYHICFPIPTESSIFSGIWGRIQIRF